MLLAFNIGNTNISLGLFKNADLIAQWRLATRRDCMADELAVFIKSVFDISGYHFHDVTGIAISSVVPPLTIQATQLAQQYFGYAPVVVGPELDIGLVNDYINPHEVGADRLVNSLAAWKKYQTAAIIVDAGTATTVDVVSKDGHFLGGAIAPGLQVSANALFQAAARLPRVELETPPHAIGRSTVTALQSGLVYGYAGLVKELVARSLAELEAVAPNEPMTIVATGGLAETIAPLVPAIQHVDPLLTLEGLRLVFLATEAHEKRV